jgi:hypothetical protein
MSDDLVGMITQRVTTIELPQEGVMALPQKLSERRSSFPILAATLAEIFIRQNARLLGE